MADFGYLSYCEATICVSDLDTIEGKSVILLVVSDTTYSWQVPVLLISWSNRGTAVSRAKDSYFCKGWCIYSLVADFSLS